MVNSKFITDILKAVKDMSIKKIIIVFICIYPILAVYYFREELSIYFSGDEVELVEITDVNSIVRHTHNIKDTFNSSAVMLFIYQPKGDEKSYKERVCYSGDSRNLFYELNKLDLIHHPKMLKDLKNNTYIKVTKDSDYALSKLVLAYGVDVAYVIPIKNDYGLIVADMVVVFDNDIHENDIKKLVSSSEILRLSL